MDLKEQYKKIFQYCYFRIPNCETAEDLTQETFLRFLEHPERARIAVPIYHCTEFVY